MSRMSLGPINCPGGHTINLLFQVCPLYIHCLFSEVHLFCGLLEFRGPTGLYGADFIRGVGLSKKVRRSRIKVCRLRRQLKKRKSDFEAEWPLQRAAPPDRIPVR